MCFIINKRYKKSKIAKKDILCYKRIRSDFKPLVFFNKRKYILNKEYLARDNKGKPITRLRITKGGDRFVGIHNSYIDEGVHSYKNKYRAFEYTGGNEILIECIIPKGVRYYENSEQYVSKKIIPVKKLTKSETIKNIFGYDVLRAAWVSE